ncbi:hypothetical protein EYF80_041681 [Liparis tanakae]|uniref:Uncharacterized protein n=1 Tax=Liparis tanakae TaxID=230148 RepID=A0A4Z2G4P5_9TELE|nr:hypothetical protein EYF80_041681 [Liparis tanakae]
MSRRSSSCSSVPIIFPCNGHLRSTSQRVTMMRMRVSSLVPAPCGHITTRHSIDCSSDIFSSDSPQQ